MQQVSTCPLSRLHGLHCKYFSTCLLTRLHSLYCKYLGLLLGTRRERRDVSIPLPLIATLSSRLKVGQQAKTSYEYSNVAPSVDSFFYLLRTCSTNCDPRLTQRVYNIPSGSTSTSLSSVIGCRSERASIAVPTLFLESDT
jgi:hypothetical protein